MSDSTYSELPTSSEENDGPKGHGPWKFRLYVAGSTPKSVRATANLYRLCKKYIRGEYQVEIVDVLEDPSRSSQDNILSTPTLIKLSPPPTCRILGTLEDTDEVLEDLGIEKDNEAI